MRRPDFIRPGDTLGLVAPSFGATMEPYATRLAAAIRKFEERGYHVVCADSVYKDDGLGISTKPEDAARDVMEFYLDDRIDALLSVGGGELMNETISCIDFKRLGEAKPKWFMGYSDNTNFLLPMAVLAGVQGIYGPCAASFGRAWGGPETQALMLLEGRGCSVTGYELFERPFGNEEGEEPDPLAPPLLTEPKKLVTFLPEEGSLRRAGEEEPVRFSGTLLGGCLDIMANLAGTEFDGVRSFCKRNGNVIWVIEACDLSPMSIRRSLWSLSHCGWFDTAAGFLVGRPLAAFGADMMGVNQYNAVTDVLAGFGVPVIMDCDIGHVAPMMPLVIGAASEAEARGNELRVRMG